VHDRVFNSGSSLRYQGTAKSITVTREAGSTCAQVYAYRSQAAYSAGAPASHAGPVCATTYSAPSTPTDAQVSGGRYMGAYMWWTAKSGATYYQYSIDVRYSSGGSFSPLVTNATTTGTSTTSYSVNSGLSYIEVRGRARACNSTGCSAWSAWDHYVLP